MENISSALFNNNISNKQELQKALLLPCFPKELNNRKLDVAYFKNL